MEKVFTLLIFAISPLALFATAANDRQIEDVVQTSYNYRIVLDNQVRVTSQDGVVTLSGMVVDKDDKALAADTVKNLRGVVRTDNQITIDPTYPERSDKWIVSKIHGRLLVQGNVSAANTSIFTRDGNVRLSGTADTTAQKELTEAYTKDVLGVKTVENNLVVKNSREIVSSTDRDRIDDVSITTQVKIALLRHKSTSALKPEISTSNGVVHIGGEASSNTEMDLVTKLANDVRGTQSVSNEMRVKS
jgi:osmotically-inducible protein OsmY